MSEYNICWACKHFGHVYATGGFCKIKSGDLKERAVDALDTCDKFELNESGAKQDEGDS